jgi:dimeric dUTPase (all-alpha-NTP-PPase superfamily)
MTTETKQQEIDKLARIFEMQTELNDYVFRKNRLTGADGELLTMAAIFRDAGAGRLKVNELPNTWLSRYATAMKEELKELDEDLLWKWWSRDEVDLQNIRVELIDILHFLVSAMICAGLTADKVFDVYAQKHAVNLKRQDDGYSRATKTEDDNRGIG